MSHATAMQALRRQLQQVQQQDEHRPRVIAPVSWLGWAIAALVAAGLTTLVLTGVI